MAMLWSPGQCVAMGPKIFKSIITWDHPPDPTVTGYWLYWGKQSGIFTNYREVPKMAQVPPQPSPSLDLMTIGLSSPGIYYFVVTAHDQYYNESDFSNEISWAFLVISPPADFHTP
jgi:hypothetical protein